ncbi:MAG: hypothetical protein WCE57_05430 [Salegentibacter sp.]
MILIVNKHLLGHRFNGMSLWPFLIMRSEDLKKDRIFIDHERIHLRQQAELLVLPFYIWYFAEYLIRLLQYRDQMKAYRNISFEKEAYHHERHKDYLSHRRFWAFLAYL